MLNIQEVVDDLLIPGKFPPPTFCRYFGKDFPVPLQQAIFENGYGYIELFENYAEIEWRSNNFQGQNKICYLVVFISKMQIYVYTIPSNFEKSLWPSLPILWPSTQDQIPGEWQKFVSTELPKWFNLANELVPMKLFKEEDTDA